MPSAASAYLQIFKRHISSVGQPAFRHTAGRTESVLATPGGAAVAALLRDLCRYSRDVPMVEKSRFLASAVGAAGGEERRLRTWSAVLPWERARGLSSTPGDALSDLGVTGAAESAMLFSAQPSRRQLRAGAVSSSGDRFEYDTTFWSGGIVAPIDVAFVECTVEPAYAAHGTRVLDDAPWLPCGDLVDVTGLTPFPVGYVAAVRGSTRHLATSRRRDVGYVLETSAGWFGRNGAAAGARLQLSPELVLDVRQKADLQGEFVVALEGFVEGALIAVCRRAADPITAGEPLHDDEAELAVLAHRLGVFSDALHDVEQTLARDAWAAARAAGRPADADGKGRVLSEGALALLRDAVGDRSIDTPKNLADAVAAATVTTAKR
jgi:hypothetical protein